MSVKCISLGNVNKYIFLVLIGSIVHSILYTTEIKSKFFESENNHPIVYIIIYSFGLCLSISLLLIKKICSKRRYNKTLSQEKNPYLFHLTKTKGVSKKEKILWILLVSVIDFILNVVNYSFLERNYFFSYYLSFGILFLSLFSYKILNYKLYKHHYLSIIIMSLIYLLTLIMDLLYNKDKKHFFLQTLIGTGTTVIYCFELTIDKYLIFSKYINSYEILFFQGIFELILGVISLIITTKYDFLDNFLDYYNQLDKVGVNFLIVLLLLNFIYYSLVITIIDILTPFFIFFIFNVSNIFIILISFFLEDFNYLSILFFLLSLIFVSILLLIFTEIIELNCFGLSYMTKRNIELRAQLDSIIEENDKERNDSVVGFQGYIVELNSAKEEEQLLPKDTESSKEIE